MSAKHNWELKVSTLLEQVGHYLEYELALGGANRSQIRVNRRGYTYVLDWTKNRRKSWVSMRINCPYGRDLYIEWSSKDKLHVTDWSRYKDDWQKLHKQMERALINMLDRKIAVEVLQWGSDNYKWARANGK